MRKFAPLFLILGAVFALVLVLSEAQKPAMPTTPSQPSKPQKPDEPLHKPTLLVFTQSGCGPCQKLKQSLADDRVKEALRGYVVRELDVSSDEGKEYRIRSTPTMVIVDPPRKPSIKAGYQTPEQLLGWLKSVHEWTVGKFLANGPRGPGGLEIDCDLPLALRMKNTGGIGPRGPGSGSGLCVFTSLEHSFRWQNERSGWGFQEKMTHEEGGGWPEKVDKMIKKYVPDARYIQYEGKDPRVLEIALSTGRMPAVTYNGHDGVFYTSVIAHMVNLVFLGQKDGAILDNNNPEKILWMSREEFLDRWKGRGSGWAVVVLNPRPPAPPHNEGRN